MMIALATVLAVLLNSPLLKARGAVPLRLLRAGRGRRGRLFRGVPADVQPRLRHRQQARSTRVGPAERRLVLQRHAGDGADHHGGDLALGRLQRHHHPRRPAVDPRGRLRGGDARPASASSGSSSSSPCRCCSRSSLFCVVLSIIGTMQLFTEPFLITNRGGPGGGTETLGLLPLPPGLHGRSISAMPRRSPTPSRRWRW